MKLSDLKANWDRFARVDPMWAILTAPQKRWNRWSVDEFFISGEREIAGLMARARELGRPFGRKRALDFGCGIGRLTQALAMHFDECWGVDISGEMIELAKQHNRHGKRCHYVINDTDRLPMLETSFFDLVYTSLVLQHIENRFVRSYLEEFMRVLRPDGLLVCQIPSRRQWSGSLREGRGRFGTRWAMEEMARRWGLAPVVGAARQAKAVATTVLGRAGVASLLYRLKLIGVPAVMETYAFERSEVEAFLVGCGASILSVESSDDVGPDFESFRFYVAGKCSGRI